MAINFPSSPILDQIFTSGNTSFIWNGTAWVGYSTSFVVNYNASSIVIKDDNSIVGATTSINFGDNLTVSTISAGIVTVTGSASGSSSQFVTTAAGIHTLSNVGIGTTNPTEELHIYGTAPDIQIESTSSTNASQLLFKNNVGNFSFIGKVGSAYNNISYPTFSPNSLSIYNIDNSNLIFGTNNLERFRVSGGGNVGIGTTNPTSKLTVSGDVLVSGVSTFRDYLDINNSSSSSSSLRLHNVSLLSAAGNFTKLSANASALAPEVGGGYAPLHLRSNNEIILQSVTDFSPVVYAGFTTTSSYLNYLGVTKLQTIGTGITVTGTTFTNNLSVSGIASVGTGITMYGSTGIISATTFYGNVVGNISGSITDATNLTGGYANASQLNVSGVTTISQGRIQADGSSNLRFGNIAAGSGSGRNIAIGDQVLYSLSSGQGRNIGIGELSYYDTTSGQYNIGLGIQAGQKITTGNYNVILGGYDGQTGLDIRTSSNNVVIADGQGNIRQYINSSGNVGIKTTVITEALTVSGIVSATSFYGTLNAGQLTGSLPAINGSALIGVVGSGSGVIIQGNGTPVGTAGTINFASNLNVTFASGIATVSGASSVSNATTAYGLAGSPNVSLDNVTAGVTTLRTTTLNILNTNGVNFETAFAQFGNTGWIGWRRIGSLGQGRMEFVSGFLNADINLKSSSNIILENFDGLSVYAGFSSTSSYLNHNNSKKFETTGYGVSITGGINAPIGIITASSFSGSGSGLTNLPAGQLTGTLPAIDGSALLNVTAAGTGIAIRDDNSNIGSATTVNFGTGLDVTFSSGIATITASGGSLQSRTTVSGVTTSITNLGIGNTDITGFKSYALMKVGLSTTGWLRIYTDSTSRANDASRSVGEDPAPGSGVIAEVVTTGISTTQIISPFVMGGNLDNSPTTTIYASIKNLSGSTQTITANLTILQLEA